MNGTDGPSQFEMGMSSVVSLLQNISKNTEEGTSFLKLIRMDLLSYIQSSTSPFAAISEKATGFQKIMLMRQTQTVHILSEILTGVNAIINRLGFKSNKDNGKDQNGDVNKSFRIGGKGDTFIDKNVNLYFEKLKGKDVVDFDKFMMNMTKFVQMDPKKMDAINDFLEGMGKNMEGISKFAFRAAISVAMFSGAMFLLSMVQLTGMVKFIMLLGILGLGIGLFVKRVVKAFNGVSWVKTWLILRSLPEMFEGIGKGIMFMSIGLLFFNYVGYEAMFKLITTIGLMGLTFKLYQDGNGEFVSTYMLLALGFAIFIFAEQLLKISQVPWDSIFKIGTFIITLGLALKVANFQNTATGLRNPLTLFALSIGLLTINLMQYTNISWGSIMKIGVFIVTVGLSLKVFNGNRGFSPMTVFALGMMLLTLSLADFQELDIMAIVQIIGVIGMLGVVLNYFINRYGIGSRIGNFADMGQMGDVGGSMSLIGFAFGLAFMALAIWALSEVPISAVLKTVTFIAGLGLALRLYGKNTKMSGMMGFGLGLGIMILAMSAMEEISWESMFKTLTFVVGLGLAIRIMNGRGVPPLLKFAFGLGLMILAMSAMEELPWEAIGKTLLFLGGLGLVMKLFGTNSALSMIGVSIGLLVVVHALKKFKESGFDMKDSLNLAVAIGTVVGLMAIIGIPAVASLVGLGALVVAGVGIALYLAAVSFKKISELDMDPLKIVFFFGAVTLVSLGFAALSFVMMPAIVGAILFIAVGLAALIGAEALDIIGKSDYNLQSIGNFMLGVDALAQGFMDNSLKMIPAALAAVLFLPVAVAALLGAGTLFLISKLTLDQKKLETYNTQVKTLVENMSSFGLISLAKTALKAIALLPIIGTSFLAALTLKKISEVNIDRAKLGLFGEMMSYMVDTILVSLASNEDKLKNAKPGLEALAKLLSVSKGLAESIQLIANLKFYDYEVVNGKLKLKSVRQLTDKDFKAVSVNIATMLETLIKPLETLGGNSSTFMIGGKVIANPFKNNDTLKGIDLLYKMGTAYKPLAESIKLLADSRALMDPKSTNTFTRALIAITNTYAVIFKKMSEMDDDAIESSIKSITEFNNGFKEVPVTEITKLDKILGSFIDKITEDVKWKKIRTNMNFLRQQFAAMAKAVNSIDIEKATAFERNVKQLVERNNGEGLKEAVDSLRELIGMVGQGGGNVQQTPYQAPFSMEPFAAPTKQNKTNNDDTDVVTRLENLFNSMLSLLGGIDDKLGNKLKVQVVGGAGNAI